MWIDLVFYSRQEMWEIALKKLQEKATHFFKESVQITQSFASEVQVICPFY